MAKVYSFYVHTSTYLHIICYKCFHTATQVSSIINKEAIRQAILNEFACNPTVRTTAEIILQIATDHNTTRVEEIRRLLEGIFTQIGYRLSIA